MNINEINEAFDREYEKYKNSPEYKEGFSLKTNAITSPKYVGGYQIGGSMGLRFNFTKKPIWLHRKMMALCLGWKWRDET